MTHRYIFTIILSSFMMFCPLKLVNASFISWIKGVASCKGRVYIHHYAYPVMTSGGGGPSSMENPQIVVHYKGCFSLIGKFEGSRILSAGDMEHMKGFTYAAFVMPSTSTCTNKCAMGYIKNNSQSISCMGSTLLTCGDSSRKSCIVGQASSFFPISDLTGRVLCGGFIYPHCDYQLTEQYIKLCQVYPSMVGICAYHSKRPDIIDFAFFGGETNISMFTDSTALSERFFSSGGSISDTFINKLSDRMDLIACYPIPMRPMPPPFCDAGMKPMGSLDVVKVCEKGEYPVHVLNAGKSQTCTLPLNQVDHSSYDKVCARIAFNNSKEESNPLCSSNVVKEKLYTTTDKKLFRDQAEVYLGSGNWKKSTLYGCNDSDYHDICYDFANNIASSVTMKDQYGNIRTFVTEAKKEGSFTGVGQASTNAQSNQESTKMCVKEKGTNIERGCVDRPEISKPRVRLCGEIINNPEEFCMYVYLGNKECFFMLDPTGSKNTCPANFGLSLTDNCGNELSKADQGKCIKYNDCCNTTSISPLACAKQAGLHYSTKVKRSSGMTKVCLTGYDTEMSPAWCTKNCNRICTDKTTLGAGGMITSNKICDRTNPAPPNSVTGQGFGKLGDNQFCGVPSSQTSLLRYRGRNAVEDDLCVDIYPFKFCPKLKNISDADKKLYEGICNDVQFYCSRVDSFYKSNHYKNFDECVGAFVNCKKNPQSTITLNKKNYKCEQINVVLYSEEEPLPKLPKPTKSQTSGGGGYTGGPLFL